MFHAGFRPFATATLLALAACPALAQDIGPDDWGLKCEAQGCVVFRPVKLDGGDQSLSLTYAVSSGGGPVRMAILTPLGTALEPGLQVSYGTVSATIRFVTCLPDGCAALVDMSPDDLSNMLVQPALAMKFQAVNRAEPYDVTVQLAGLDDAIDLARKGGKE